MTKRSILTFWWRSWGKSMIFANWRGLLTGGDTARHSAGGPMTNGRLSWRKNTNWKNDMANIKEPIRRTKRFEILSDANDLLHGGREDDYGSPQASFERIAQRWNQRACRHDGEPLTASDVALMMADLKMARLAQSGELHIDSVLDGIGYFALAFEVHTGDG